MHVLLNCLNRCLRKTLVTILYISIFYPFKPCATYLVLLISQKPIYTNSGVALYSAAPARTIVISGNRRNYCLIKLINQLELMRTEGNMKYRFFTVCKYQDFFNCNYQQCYIPSRLRSILDAEFSVEFNSLDLMLLHGYYSKEFPEVNLYQLCDKTGQDKTRIRTDGWIDGGRTDG